MPLSIPSACLERVLPLLNQGMGAPNQYDIRINLRRIEPFALLGYNRIDDSKRSSRCRSLRLARNSPWQKPPSKRSRQILLPHNASRSKVRPEQFERRARLVSAIARGRRWLDDVVSGRVTTVAKLCTRENCSVRQVNMTISLAFLAPNLVKAAVEGRLPRGIGIERLRDPPTEWSRQFEALGLDPE